MWDLDCQTIYLNTPHSPHVDCQKCAFSKLRSQSVRIPSPATWQGHPEVPSLVSVKDYKQSMPCDMVIYSGPVQNAFNKYHYVVMFCPMIPLAEGDKVCSSSFNPKTENPSDARIIQLLMHQLGKVLCSHLWPNCHNSHQAADQRLLIRLWPRTREVWSTVANPKLNSSLCAIIPLHQTTSVASKSLSHSSNQYRSKISCPFHPTAVDSPWRPRLWISRCSGCFSMSPTPCRPITSTDCRDSNVHKRRPSINPALMARLKGFSIRSFDWDAYNLPCLYRITEVVGKIQKSEILWQFWN